MTAKRISLAQQIAQLQDTAPVDFDPEDTQFHETQYPEDGEDVSSAREHYFSVGPSLLRRQHASIADPKYDGVKTTRLDLIQADAIEEAEDDNREEETSSAVDDRLHEEPEGSEPGNGSMYSDQDQHEVSSHGEDGDVDTRRKPLETSPIHPEQLHDPGSALQKTREEDRVKGRAVSRQIAIWDTLLDARIRLQKCASSANKLPAPSDRVQFLDASECLDSLNKMFEEALHLCDELFSLQEYLLSSNEAVIPPPRKRRRTFPVEDKISNYETEFLDATEFASSLEHSFHGHLVRTLSKWSSKIQAVAPSVLLASTRNSFSSRSLHHLKTVVQLIDETLEDHAKVVARTQVPRGKTIRVGSRAQETPGDDDDHPPDVEIFDDTDFYQQLLRDIIDSRGNGIGNNEDWTAMQKQRKLKKKVDTKASKGRKLRYEVHEKLQNFMVPVPIPGSWHDEQIDELFTSLLGKGFEDEYVDSLMDLSHNGLEHDAEEVLNGGFRVFG